MPSPSFTPWSRVESDPDFSSFSPEQKKTTFDNWREQTLGYIEANPDEFDENIIPSLKSLEKRKLPAFTGSPTAQMDADNAANAVMAEEEARRKRLEQAETEFARLNELRMNKASGLFSGIDQEELTGLEQKLAGKEDSLTKLQGALNNEEDYAIVEGQFIPSPRLALDKDAYNKAVRAADLDREEKIRALLARDSNRERAGQAMYASIKKLGGLETELEQADGSFVGIPVSYDLDLSEKFRNFEDIYRQKNAGKDFTEADIMAAWAKENSGMFDNAWTQIKGGVFKAAIGTVQGYYGLKQLMGWGDQEEAQAAAKITGEMYQDVAEATETMGGATGIGTASEIVAGTAFAMPTGFGGRVAVAAGQQAAKLAGRAAFAATGRTVGKAAVTEAAKKAALTQAAKLQTAGGVAAAGIGAGLQQAGGAYNTYKEEYLQQELQELAFRNGVSVEELSDEDRAEAEEAAVTSATYQALRAGFVEGVITMIGGASGAEAFARSPAPGALREIIREGTTKYLTKTVGKEIVGEAVEEGSIALTNGLLDLLSVNSDKLSADPVGALTELAGQTFESAAWGGALGGGMSSLKATVDVLQAKREIRKSPALTAMSKAVAELRKAGMTQTADALASKRDEEENRLVDEVLNAEDEKALASIEEAAPPAPESTTQYRPAGEYLDELEQQRAQFGEGDDTTDLDAEIDRVKTTIAESETGREAMVEVAPAEEASSAALEKALQRKQEVETQGGLTGEWKPAAADEPEIPKGFVRFYHAGSAGEGITKRWLSPSRQWVKSFRPGAPVWFVDIPVNDPQLRKSFDDSGTPYSAPFVNFDADEATSARLQALETPPAAEADQQPGTPAPVQPPAEETPAPVQPPAPPTKEEDAAELTSQRATLNYLRNEKLPKATTEEERNKVSAQITQTEARIRQLEAPAPVAGARRVKKSAAPQGLTEDDINALQATLRYSLEELQKAETQEDFDRYKARVQDLTQRLRVAGITPQVSPPTPTTPDAEVTPTPAAETPVPEAEEPQAGGVPPVEGESVVAAPAAETPARAPQRRRQGARDKVAPAPAAEEPAPARPAAKTRAKTRVEPPTAPAARKSLAKKAAETQAASPIKKVVETLRKGAKALNPRPRKLAAELTPAQKDSAVVDDLINESIQSGKIPTGKEIGDAVTLARKTRGEKGFDFNAEADLLEEYKTRAKEKWESLYPPEDLPEGTRTRLVTGGRKDATNAVDYNPAAAKDAKARKNAEDRGVYPVKLVPVNDLLPAQRAAPLRKVLPGKRQLAYEKDLLASVEITARQSRAEVAAKAAAQAALDAARAKMAAALEAGRKAYTKKTPVWLQSPERKKITDRFGGIISGLQANVASFPDVSTFYLAPLFTFEGRKGSKFEQKGTITITTALKERGTTVPVPGGEVYYVARDSKNTPQDGAEVFLPALHVTESRQEAELFAKESGGTVVTVKTNEAYVNGDNRVLISSGYSSSVDANGSVTLTPATLERSTDAWLGVFTNDPETTALQLNHGRLVLIPESLRATPGKINPLISFDPGTGRVTSAFSPRIGQEVEAPGDYTPGDEVYRATAAKSLEQRMQLEKLEQETGMTYLEAEQALAQAEQDLVKAQTAKHAADRSKHSAARKKALEAVDAARGLVDRFRIAMQRQLPAMLAEDYVSRAEGDKVEGEDAAVQSLLVGKDDKGKPTSLIAQNIETLFKLKGYPLVKDFLRAGDYTLVEQGVENLARVKMRSAGNQLTAEKVGKNPGGVSYSLTEEVLRALNARLASHRRGYTDSLSAEVNENGTPMLDLLLDKDLAEKIDLKLAEEEAAVPLTKEERSDFGTMFRAKYSKSGVIDNPPLRKQMAKNPAMVRRALDMWRADIPFSILEDGTLELIRGNPLDANEEQELRGNLGAMLGVGVPGLPGAENPVDQIIKFPTVARFVNRLSLDLREQLQGKFPEWAVDRFTLEQLIRHSGGTRDAQVQHIISWSKQAIFASEERAADRQIAEVNWLRGMLALEPTRGRTFAARRGEEGPGPAIDPEAVERRRVLEKAAQTQMLRDAAVNMERRLADTAEKLQLAKETGAATEVIAALETREQLLKDGLASTRELLASATAKENLAPVGVTQEEIDRTKEEVRRRLAFTGTQEPEAPVWDSMAAIRALNRNLVSDQPADIPEPAASAEEVAQMRADLERVGLPDNATDADLRKALTTLATRSGPDSAPPRIKTLAMLLSNAIAATGITKVTIIEDPSVSFDTDVVNDTLVVNLSQVPSGTSVFDSILRESLRSAVGRLSNPSNFGSLNEAQQEAMQALENLRAEALQQAQNRGVAGQFSSELGALNGFLDGVFNNPEFINFLDYRTGYPSKSLRGVLARVWNAVVKLVTGKEVKSGSAAATAMFEASRLFAAKPPKGAAMWSALSEMLANPEAAFPNAVPRPLIERVKDKARVALTEAGAEPDYDRNNQTEEVLDLEEMLTPADGINLLPSFPDPRMLARALGTDRVPTPTGTPIILSPRVVPPAPAGTADLTKDQVFSGMQDTLKTLDLLSKVQEGLMTAEEAGPAVLPAAVQSALEQVRQRLERTRNSPAANKDDFMGLLEDMEAFLELETEEVDSSDVRAAEIRGIVKEALESFVAAAEKQRAAFAEAAAKSPPAPAPAPAETPAPAEEVPLETPPVLPAPSLPTGPAPVPVTPPGVKVDVVSDTINEVFAEAGLTPVYVKNGYSSMYATYGDERIFVDAEQLRADVAGLLGREGATKEQVREYIRAAIREELDHIEVARRFRLADILVIADQMTDAEVTEVLMAYFGVDPSKGENAEEVKRLLGIAEGMTNAEIVQAKYALVQEHLRRYRQKASSGFTTEDRQRMVGRPDSFVSRVVDYLRGLKRRFAARWQAYGDPAALRSILNTDDFLAAIGADPGNYSDTVDVDFEGTMLAASAARARRVAPVGEGGAPTTAPVTGPLRRTAAGKEMLKVLPDAVREVLGQTEYWTRSMSEDQKFAAEAVTRTGGDTAETAIEFDAAMKALSKQDLTGPQEMIARALLQVRANLIHAKLKEELDTTPSVEAARDLDQLQDFIFQAARTELNARSTAGTALQVFQQINAIYNPAIKPREYTEPFVKAVKEKIKATPGAEEAAAKIRETVKKARTTAAEKTVKGSELPRKIAAAALRKLNLKESAGQSLFDFMADIEALQGEMLETMDEKQFLARFSGGLPLRVQIANWAAQKLVDRALKEFTSKAATAEQKGVLEELGDEVRAIVSKAFDMELKKVSPEEKAKPSKDSLARLIFDVNHAELLADAVNQARERILAKAALPAGATAEQTAAYNKVVEAARGLTFDSVLATSAHAVIRRTFKMRQELAGAMDRSAGSLEMLSKLAQELGDLNPAQADAVAKVLIKAYREEAAAEAKRELDNFAKAKLEKTVGDRELTRLSKSERLIRLIRLGAFSDETYYNALAEEYDLPAYDPDVLKEIERKALDIGGMPVGSVQRVEMVRNLNSDILRATLDTLLKKYGYRGMLKDKKLISTYLKDVPLAMWKSGILSGFGTAEVNFLAGALQSIMDLSHSAIGYGLAAKDPGLMAKNFGYLLKEFLTLGNGEALTEIRRAASTGSTRFISEQAEHRLILEQDLPLPPGLKQASKFYKGIGRIISIIDATVSVPAYRARQQMAMAYALSQEGTRGAELRRIINNSFTPEGEMLAKIEKQLDAEQRQFNLLPRPDLVRAARRNQLLEQERAKMVEEIGGEEDLIEAGREAARMANLSGRPQGIAGAFFDGLFGALERKTGGLTAPIMTFTRSLGNLFDFSLAMSVPLLPFFRARNASLSNRLLPEGLKAYARKQVEPGSVEYHKLNAQGAVALALQVAAVMLFMQGMEDEEEGKVPLFMVYGEGYDDPEKNAQLRLRQPRWFPNTVKIGPAYLSWKDVPGLNIVLGAMAGISDTRLKNSTKNLDRVRASEFWVSAGHGVLRSAFVKNALTSLENVATAVGKGSTSGEKAVKFLTSVPAGIATPRLISDVANVARGLASETGDYALYDRNSMLASVVSMMPVSDLYADKFGVPKLLNARGVEVTNHWYAPLIKRVAPAAAEEGYDPIITPLASAGLFLNPPSDSDMPVYVYEDKDSDTFSEEAVTLSAFSSEAREFAVKMYGELMTRGLENNGNLQKLTDYAGRGKQELEVAQEELSKMSTSAKRAVQRALQQAVKERRFIPHFQEE